MKKADSKKIPGRIIAILFCLMVSITAQAAYITVVDADPTNLNFYIPLTEGESGDYANGAGTSSDSVTLSRNGSSGGLLGLELMFTPVPAVFDSATLNITFYDLDLLSYDIGNTVNFFETAELSYRETTIAFLDEQYWIANGSGQPTNNNQIDLSFNLVPNLFADNQLQLLNPLLIDLELSTSLTKEEAGDWSTRLRNTKESVSANITFESESVSVPEPSTLMLMCIGMAGLGLSGRKQRKG